MVVNAYILYRYKLKNNSHLTQSEKTYNIPGSPNILILTMRPETKAKLSTTVDNLITKYQDQITRVERIVGEDRNCPTLFIIGEMASDLSLSGILSNSSSQKFFKTGS